MHRSVKPACASGFARFRVFRRVVAGDRLLGMEREQRALRQVVQQALDRVLAQVEPPELHEPLQDGLVWCFGRPATALGGRLGAGVDVHQGLGEAIAAQVGLLSELRQLDPPRRPFLRPFRSTCPGCRTAPAKR